MRSRSSMIVSFFAVLGLVACSSGGASPTGGAGNAGSAGVGAAGAGSGIGGSAAGAAGTAINVPGPTGAAGGSGGETPTGAAGDTGAAGATGVAGTTGAAGAAAAGSGGHDGGAATDGGSASDGPATTVDAARGNRVLIYTRATGFVHDSTPTAAAAITKSAATFGLVCETSQDQTKFTAAGLAPYAAIVLLASTGEPFGSPGTAQIQALVDYVQGGGALVGIENANHAYDNSVPYISLVGGDFNGHSGFGPDTCYSDGMHPSNVKLPAMFPVTDEIYYTSKFNPDNQIVLRCGSDKRAISWVRTQGSGRVFYTTLGHASVEWTTPPLVDQHVVPGLLWAMGR